MGAALPKVQFGGTGCPNPFERTIPELRLGQIRPIASHRFDLFSANDLPTRSHVTEQAALFEARVQT